MTLFPPTNEAGFDLTHVVVAAELKAAISWASRHGWSLTYDVGTKSGKAVTTHPVTGTLIEFHFDATGYPDR